MNSLEALEVIKHTTDLDRPNELNGYHNEINIIEKHLKALEIIKNKTVIFVDMLIDSKELKEYNDYVIHCLQLTEEEWKLLKEVLNGNKN